MFIFFELTKNFMNYLLRGAIIKLIEQKQLQQQNQSQFSSLYI